MSTFNKLDALSVETANSCAISFNSDIKANQILSVGDCTSAWKDNIDSLGYYNPEPNHWVPIYDWYEYPRKQNDYKEIIDSYKKILDKKIHVFEDKTEIKKEEKELTKNIVAYNVLVLDDKEETGSKNRVITTLTGTIIGSGRWDDDQSVIVLKRAADINSALQAYNHKNNCELTVEDLKILNVFLVSTPLITKKKD